MRKPAIVFLIGLLLAAAAFFLRFQPSGSATVFRHGDELSVRETAIYLRPALIDAQCRVSTSRGLLAFDRSVIAQTRIDDEFPMRVRFRYTAPAAVPAGWPQGDWCSSVERRVRTAAREWAATRDADHLLDDRRGEGDAAAAAITSALASSGVRAAGVSARLDLPPGFERLRLVREVASQTQTAPPVVFVGLDGADWDLLDGYMQSGVMPALAAVVRSGAGGVLMTEQPPLSPLIWTTMMTGVSPLDHQILDFTRFNPQSGIKEPITSDERRAPAVWNDLTYAGKESSVFGLWATYAAEPLHGTNVSDRLFTFLYEEKSRPPGVVYPPTRQAASEEELRAAERAVDIGCMRSYLPWLTDDDYGRFLRNENPYGEPAAALRRILVETEVYRRLSDRFVGEMKKLPALTIVYLQGTDTIGHVFAPFAPPKQKQVSQQDYDRFHTVAERYFGEIDRLIGGYVTLAKRNGAVLMIASDHGFYWHEGRPTALSSTATATAAKWHRPEGIWVIQGPGIAAAPNHPYRGGVRQVLPTLLALTGMPSPAGAPLPLAPIAPRPRAIDYSRFFSSAAPPPATTNRSGDDEAIAKLKALGYIGSTESSTRAAGSGTKTAGAYNNEGLILRNEKRPDAALQAFERALTLDPKYASAMWNESETLFVNGREPERSDALLIKALNNGLADGVSDVITRAIACSRNGQRPRAISILDAAIGAKPGEGELRLFRGRYLMESHDCARARADFDEATRLRPDDPIAFASAGLAQACLGDMAAARASFERSLQLDPNQPGLRQMLGR